ADPRLIPGARRVDYRQAGAIAPLGDRVLVICHRGLKLSQGVAAQLRARGIVAETLLGGMVAWSEGGFPTLKAGALPPPGPWGRVVWVTRQRPKVDRIACPWLIRRFIDPLAEFLFVAPSQVLAVAGKFDAIPFDVEGAFWSHRGENCSFDTFLEETGLEMPALAHLARLVRAADTNRLDTEPEAAGLLAASLGLSRIYRDDLAQLEAGLPLYDMFFRWARDATAEGHDWP
ncbi:MAG: sulfurtransferase/chromate resistance protein, partial [Pseudomonadota bacterium]